MSTMLAGSRLFGAVVVAGWLLMIAGIAVYASLKSTPYWAAVPVGMAFAFEFPFYILPAFPRLREGLLAVLGKFRFVFLLAASSVIPWLIYSSLTGEFAWLSLLLLLLIASLISFWYLLLPVSPPIDVVFLGLLSAIVAGKLFASIYLSPIPKVDLSILGHLMLIRSAALSILCLRGFGDAQLEDAHRPQYRFWPRPAEWLTGLRYFAFLIPIAGFVYWALGLAEFRERPLNMWQAMGTFFGILWVTALSEEFFFRGLLQGWLEKWTASATISLVAVSLLFGSAHLGMHRQFPNWRFAIVAAVAGFFYGLAWRRSRSVQASMVAHALTVTLWRTFFR